MAVSNSMSRRKFLTVSTLGITAGVLASNYGSKMMTSLSAGSIVSRYEIAVSPDSYLYQLINTAGEKVDHIHVSHALDASELNKAWIQSYSQAKQFALDRGCLTKTEKFYNSENKTFSVISYWSSFGDYVDFLRASDLSNMHDLLKKRGLNPALTVTDHLGKTFKLNRYS